MKRVGSFLVPDRESVMLESLEHRGGWQIERLVRALTHVTDFSCAIDGGAHVGSWTRVMAQRFTTVWAFEPAPETYRCLVANTSSLPNVRPRWYGLGARQGFAEIADDERYNGANTGGQWCRLDRIGTIEIMPIDSLPLTSLGFLKLDIEGMEVLALRGAFKTLKRLKPVVMIEDKVRFAPRYGVPAHAASLFLRDLGARECDRIGDDIVYRW